MLAFKSNCTARFNNNILAKNVANYGAKPTDTLTVTRNGDYVNIAISIHETIYPLFNSYHIQIIDDNIDNNFTNSLTLIQKYNLHDEYKQYGNDIFKYIVDQFMLYNDHPQKYNDYKIDPNNVKQLSKRIKQQLHNTLPVTFHIIDYGKLLPSDWINKEFKNGDELHKEIDNLDSRMTLPPCTYLCTYEMELTKPNKTKKFKKSLVNNIYLNPSTMKFQLDSINTSNMIYFELLNYNIVFNIDDIFIEPIEYLNVSVGYYCSLLQKSIRRQSKNTIHEAIHNLSKARPYNNPQMNYTLINPSRQLFYRLFITIIEDIGLFNSITELDIFDLILYSKICELYPYKQLNISLINKLCILASKLTSTKQYINFGDYKPYKLQKNHDMSDNINNRLFI